eukprot:1156674-Pelagomonas_calceolata.AAC.18
MLLSCRAMSCAYCLWRKWVDAEGMQAQILLPVDLGLQSTGLSILNLTRLVPFLYRYFIFTSFWNYKVYYVYGFMLLVLILLIMVGTWMNEQRRMCMIFSTAAPTCGQKHRPYSRGVAPDVYGTTDAHDIVVCMLLRCHILVCAVYYLGS